MGLGMGLVPYPWVGSWVIGVSDKGDGHGSSLGRPDQTRPIASLSRTRRFPCCGLVFFNEDMMQITGLLLIDAW
jgi:hypothetical protein